MPKELSELKGLGPKRLSALENVGIRTLRDLALFLPASYRDLTAVTSLEAVRPGYEGAYRVRIAGEVSTSYHGRLVMTKAHVTDDTDTLSVIWYNQPWLKTQLSKGQELLLYGKCEAFRNTRRLVSPIIEHEERILPVYRRIPGLPEKQLRECVEKALESCAGSWQELLPEALRRRHGLCERNFAVRQAHFPDSMEALAAARYRLAFEELLLYQLALSMIRHRGEKGVQIAFPKDACNHFWTALPFPPTKAQQRTLEEIAADLASPFACARMIQGDVGCGKTAVAFGAIYLAKQGGWQSALMAPTEVLAQQHYAAAKQTLEPLGLKVGLLTGSMGQKDHRLAHEAIASGEWDLVIGTHALITEGVEYKKLGLTITDEQHRFGVRQRTQLSGKGDSPNVLVMSATPIPRTLSLVLFGDLDLSVIDELPPGRKTVKTRIVSEKKRPGLYDFLRSEVHMGRQIYVVCPLVEDSEAIEARSAQQVYEDLHTRDLPELRIELVHGKMKATDKDAALERFRRGEADVLVSTTVIEVGVNVPNASVMVVENAERFGLAQLHQLRGRVGRGSDEAWCFLMGEANERLRFMVSTNDGFEIARKDMELRGPGDLFGTRQSGSLVYGVGTLLGDSRLLQCVHDEARSILQQRDTAENTGLIEQALKVYGERFKEAGVN